jgi:prephenate dehydrogenase
MMAMQVNTLAILGVGLIGGSVALAARARGLARRVIGFEPDEKSHSRSLALGLVDEMVPAPNSSRVAGADLVICCAPVDRVAGLIESVASRARPGVLFTDVGSTKAAIVGELDQSLPPEALFVGGHPLAGSEKNGAEHASARLFEGRLVLLTPTRRTSGAAVARFTAFWEGLGARVQSIDPEEHDRAVAMTSHLPHLVASALAGVVPPELYPLTATGFRDTTRIASGDPSLWSGILKQNGPFVLAAMELLRQRLDTYRQALEAGDQERLRELLEEGWKKRQALTGG